MITDIVNNILGVIKFIKYFFLFKILFLGQLALALPNAQMRSDLKKISKIVDEGLVKYSPPGAVIAIVSPNEVLYKKVHGVRELGKKSKIDENTLFRVASVTKFFTSVLYCRLQKKGSVNLNHKIGAILPNNFFGSNSDFLQVKLLNILNHTSGAPRYTLEDRAYLLQDRKKLFSNLKNIKFIHACGEVHNYQNVIYNLLSLILESLIGDTYPRIIEKELFKPLDIKKFTLSDKDFKECQNKARPHLFISQSKKSQKIRKIYKLSSSSSSYDNIVAAGGLAISLKESIKFVQALLGNKKTINKSILKTMTNSKIFVCGQGRKCVKRQCFCKNGINHYYGLGCRIVNISDTEVIFHAGYVNGYSSILAVIPSLGVGLIVFTNANTEFPGFLLKKMCEVFITKKSAKNIVKNTVKNRHKSF